jgi:hypothetical protein
MRNKTRQTEKVQSTWSRLEVADMFGIDPKTLADWLKDANYQLRPRKAITRKELDGIFEIFGNPNQRTKT